MKVAIVGGCLVGRERVSSGFLASSAYIVTPRLATSSTTSTCAMNTYKPRSGEKRMYGVVLRTIDEVAREVVWLRVCLRGALRG